MRWVSAVVCAAALPLLGESPQSADVRDIANGRPIAAYNYADQPYVVVNRRSEWVCVLTTGRKPEGSRGQFVVSTISSDRGRTWSEPVAIEPDTGPEASWATPLIVPSGRIYVFYTYNGDDVTTLPGSSKQVRSDTHGWYAYRYSDDDGRSWSAQRYRIPLRVTSVDRGNPWKGEVCHFWGIDKPKVQNGTVYFAFTKLGRFFMEEGEGWIASSKNLLTEADPEKIEWTLLPEGDRGIRNPALGSIQEEFNLLPLGRDGLYAVNRTTNGFAACSYSFDGGRHWTLPEPMTYAPDGRIVKTPRACPKLLQASGGRFLFWYHLHGGHGFLGRNPVFLSGGRVGTDGRLRWSEPELVLYASDPKVRMSYPDLIEQDGRFWLTETQKTDARTHALDPELLDGLWYPEKYTEPAPKGVPGGGETVELTVDLSRVCDGETLLTAKAGEKGEIAVSVSRDCGKRVLRYRRRDGRTTVEGITDPGALTEGLNHVAFVCDVRAHVLLGYVNGRICDGGPLREQGFVRLPQGAAELAELTSAAPAVAVKTLRLYNRPLRTAEVLGGWRSK